MELSFNKKCSFGTDCSAKCDGVSRYRFIFRAENSYVTNYPLTYSVHIFFAHSASTSNTMFNFSPPLLGDQVNLVKLKLNIMSPKISTTE